MNHIKKQQIFTFKKLQPTSEISVSYLLSCWWTQDVQSEGGICKKNMEGGWKCGLPDQFYFTKSCPGFQQLYCGDVGVLTVVISGFPRQSSPRLVSDALVFTLAEVVLSIQFRGPDVDGCVYHRPCRQTGLEWQKKKNYWEWCVTTKCQPTEGRSTGGERPPGFWPKQ